MKASYGHVMDLPKKTIGILLPGENGNKKKKRKTKAKGKAAEKKVPKPILVTSENIFEPTYEVIPSKLKVISDLQKAAVGAEAIYLAGDPDREGEAICAHLQGDSEQAAKNTRKLSRPPRRSTPRKMARMAMARKKPRRPSPKRRPSRTRAARRRKFIA